MDIWEISEWTVALSGSDTSGSITVALPASAVYDQGMFEGRRLMIGTELSRAYFSFVRAGTTFAPFWRGGAIAHGADPTTFVGSLSAATSISVGLGGSDNTALQVYTATRAAIISAIPGIVITNAGTDDDGRILMQIDGASGLTIPPAVDTLNNSLRGFGGMQRDDWGNGAGGPALNGNGGTDNTVAVHIQALSTRATIPTATAARIVGAYIWGQGGYQPRLAAGHGPSYSTTPGSITIVGEGIVPSGLTSGDLGIVVFADPQVIDTDDELWVFTRGDTATSPGGTRFRVHGETVVGRGDLGLGELIIIDTTASFANTDTFGSSYNPTADSTAGVYLSMGLLVEIADASGNFHATGPQIFAIGDQNNDDTHGTPTLVGPGLLDDETTHQRDGLPDLPGAFPVTEIRRAVRGIASDEDSRAAFYGPWANLTVPTGSPPSLIADLGLVGLEGNPNGFTTLVLDPPVDIGAARGTNVSLGFNYVVDGGGALATYTLPVHLDASTTDNSYETVWEDDQATWHDQVRGANQRAADTSVKEYRTNGAPSTMPIDDYTDTYPSTFATDATDDVPQAIAQDRYVIARPALTSG